MKFILLGTGDAVGTPKIGCDCPQCRHAYETGTGRLRTSLLIEHANQHILIDTSPDLRQQLLKCGSPFIDAVIWTHGHYDHFMGFGEFYRVQKYPRVFAAEPVLRYCGETFRFLDFKRSPVEPYVPFDLFGISVTPFLVKHPPAYTCGFVFENNGMRVGYTSDTNRDIPEKSLRLLENLDLLLIDALVPSHIAVVKHMNYLDACTLAESLHAKDFRCIHISHVMPWEYPHLSHDGEVFDFP
ncbi:MAG: MBL fold metallo-hydrolase [Methanoregula sp.]|uniref:MBL fold metallo-hydrolase n=1 Tax=Methanoregula sp. TaxID=2052170 RepID=UPI003BAF5BB3